MSKNRFIHSLDSFSKSEKMNEADLTDMLSGFLGVAGDAVKREAKQKIIYFLKLVSILFQLVLIPQMNWCKLI